MNDKRKADLVAVLHLAIILLGMVNLPLAYLYIGYRPVVLFLSGILLTTWIIYRGCLPLQLEQRLRREHDPEGAYDTAFITHYVRKYTGIHIPRVLVRLGIYSYLSITIYIAVQ